MSGTAAVEKVTLAQLMAMAERLVQQGVGFWGCQKCVHPLVKEYLTEEVNYVTLSLRFSKKLRFSQHVRYAFYPSMWTCCI